MRGKAWFTLKWGLVGICASLLLGLGIGSNRAMPDSADVYLDETTRMFLAPTCMQEWKRRPGTGTATVMQVGTVRARGHEPDPTCRQVGGFAGGKSSLTEDLLVYLGILTSEPEWWDYTFADPVPSIVRNNPG